MKPKTKPSLKARRPRPTDPAELAPKLRAEDIQEIKSNSGATALESLTEGMEMSTPCYTVVTNDEREEVVAMFGVIATVRPDTGAVWLLAAPLLLEHSKDFIRQSPEWLDKLHEKFVVLWNFVDARNHTHIGWLKLMGVNFLSEDPTHGVDKVPFKEFIHV